MASDPVLIAYAVLRSKSTKAVRWEKIGEAYPHEEGAGLTVHLQVIPRDGVLFLFEPKDDLEVRAERLKNSDGVA